MRTQTAPELAALLHRLEQFGELDDEDRASIARLPVRLRDIGANRTIGSENETADECCVVLDGLACQYKTTARGGRQILAFQFAGDIVNAQNILLSRTDIAIQTIRASTIGWIPCRELRALIAQRPNVGVALWRYTLVEASSVRERVLSVGRGDARARVAHFIREFAARDHPSGQFAAGAIDFPMSQEVIGDAIGLTAIHVNRTLRQMEEDGLIVRAGRRITVIDAGRLCRVAGFSSGAELATLVTPEDLPNAA